MSGFALVISQNGYQFPAEGRDIRDDPGALREARFVPPEKLAAVLNARCARPVRSPPEVDYRNLNPR